MMEVIVLGGLGLAFGMFLLYISARFEVMESFEEKTILGFLPGANCSACGFASCREMAAAVLSNPNYLSRCRVLEPENRRKIQEMLGVKVEEVAKKVARICCTFETGDRFEYRGVMTCAAANLVSGGFKQCRYACLGLGDCARVCPFGAISVRDSRVLIDEKKCTGCGLCVSACPRSVIRLTEAGAAVFVACNSRDEGKVVVKVCRSGCIGCGLCARSCPVNAIKIENNLAVIDYSLCTGCGKCAEVCPRKTIIKLGAGAPES
jgi:electron transport complex protein RnfB